MGIGMADVGSGQLRERTLASALAPGGGQKHETRRSGEAGSQVLLLSKKVL